jgi:hypothetical protein
VQPTLSAGLSYANTCIPRSQLHAKEEVRLSYANTCIPRSQLVSPTLTRASHALSFTPKRKLVSPTLTRASHALSSTPKRKLLSPTLTCASHAHRSYAKACSPRSQLQPSSPVTPQDHSVQLIFITHNGIMICSVPLGRPRRAGQGGHAQSRLTAAPMLNLHLHFSYLRLLSFEIRDVIITAARHHE